MIDEYAWRGGREAMLRFGPGSGPIVVVVLPLFEEANRLRASIVAMCRRLADAGIASLLPDVPGQGESLTPLQDCTLADMRAGLAAAARAAAMTHGPIHAVAIRSGALLDTFALPERRWLFAPQPGRDLLRQLRRIDHAATLNTGAPVRELPARTAQTVTIAGNVIGRTLLDALEAADGLEVPSHGGRVVRLTGDAWAADRHVEGTALWRRSEPDIDLPLVALLADDITAWVVSCAG
ncbi:hypothetical protein [Sphingomonas sp. CARO-RG-8B-R24-01]|uniref:hypothetical protein n=1 Tax=Sphingomonas sp. CARO-RG-8B-R24-01 TaxID=2914831 RepID=UPI001F58994C|nr:hypothetical protein [Sphingomonas sp. CARO-RG-8B-R24-01]